MELSNLNPGQNLPLLTIDYCKKLNTRFNEAPVIGLWANGYPVQTVEIMLYLKNILETNGWLCILLLKKNSLEHFKMFTHGNTEYVYICDDYKILKYCPFIKLLFTNEWCIHWTIYKYFQGKIVLFPHNAARRYPNKENVELKADYILSNPPIDYKFNFKFFPNTVKQSQSRYQTIIPGNPKFDLLYLKFNNHKKTLHKRIWRVFT